MSTSQRKPWDRQPGESEGHFAWFETWLDARDRHGRRSCTEVARRVGTADSIVRRAARKHKWRERGVEVDKYINIRVCKRVRRAIRNLTRRHVETIESTFCLTGAMERKLIEMLACDVMERTETHPLVDENGKVLCYQTVTYTPPHWSLDTCVKMLKTICEMRENALLLTIDLESGRPSDRRDARKPDEPDEPLDAERAEHLRRALVEFYATHPRADRPPIPRPGDPD